MEQCEDVLHHSQLHLLHNTMWERRHIAEATTHRAAWPSTAKVAAATHALCTTCMLTMRLQHVRLSTHSVPQWQGFMHLNVSCGVPYQEALMVGHVHCWLTSWWQILNTLYLQPSFKVTQAVTRWVTCGMGAMEQQSLRECRHVIKPDALIQLTHTEPTLTP